MPGYAFGDLRLFTIAVQVTVRQRGDQVRAGRKISPVLIFHELAKRAGGGGALQHIKFMIADHHHNIIDHGLVEFWRVISSMGLVKSTPVISAPVCFLTGLICKVDSSASILIVRSSFNVDTCNGE